MTFDSYDSRDGLYGSGNINSEVTISTISVEVDAIDIGNADVYRYVATGANMPDVGPKGSITDYANPGVVDNSRITLDYYANFPDIDPPTLTSPQTSMPSSGTVMGGEYLLSSWSSNSSSPLYIKGDTTIVITGEMSFSGNGGIEIDPSASLKIYAADNINLGDNGVLNSSGKPEQLLIFGTNKTPGAQDIDISGNGFLSAAIYAPNSEVSMNGGGTNSPGSITLGDTLFSEDAVKFDGSNASTANSYFETVETIGPGLTGDGTYDPYDLDGGGKKQGDLDRFLTFKLDFQDFVDVVLSDAENGLIDSGFELFDESFALQMLVVTSQNGNNINSDFGGIDDNNADPNIPFNDPNDPNGGSGGLSLGVDPGGTVIPEPGTLMLLLGIMAGIALRRRTAPKRPFWRAATHEET